MPGDGHHSLRDRVAAVREHDIRLVDIEELPEEVHDRADVIQALPDVPGRFLANQGDRHIAPARAEHAGVVCTANRGTKLIRLVQVFDHCFEANLRGEIELGGAKRLAFEAMRREPLEDVQRGHGGAVGKVEDGVCRREQDLPARRTIVAFRSAKGRAFLDFGELSRAERKTTIEPPHARTRVILSGNLLLNHG